MEIILYITGGIALLALAWLFISLAMTVKSVQGILTDVRSDIGSVVATVDDLKTQIVPILGNVNGITSNINGITSGLQTQMISVHETIDDTLDVVRGTIDDIERLKDQLVATVEGPVTLVRSTTDGAVGALFKGVSILKRFVGPKKSDRPHANASNRPTTNGHASSDGTAESHMSYTEVARKSDGRAS